ncbi:hypothetical protein U1Q18_044676 [Sarracenia purpurea var. burkii]
METATTNPMPTEPLADLELIEENNDDNLDENDFHFGYLTVESSTDPPRCPAIALWRRVISLDHSKRTATSYPTFEFVRMEDQNEVCKLIGNLPVPRLIRELIENCLDLVRSELNEWVQRGFVVGHGVFLGPFEFQRTSIQNCAYYWSNDDESRKFIDLVDGIFDSDDLNTFKTSIAETVPKRYRWNEFDEENIHSLLSWCFNNDDQKINEFEKSLPIDDVFRYRCEAMRWYRCFDKVYINSQETHQIFVSVDKMLLWYFESVDKVKKYKLEKVFEYGDEGGWMFIRYRDRIDERYTRIVLPWFFDGDEEQILIFKEKYKLKFQNR